ncbi:MAG: hypothetical protein WCF85_19955 [Rhodospirillaceae bacterium]
MMFDHGIGRQGDIYHKGFRLSQHINAGSRVIALAAAKYRP